LNKQVTKISPTKMTKTSPNKGLLHLNALAITASLSLLA